ncbi:Anaphase promoting complex subunit 1 [Paramicrosporidium saccamoebae]|uniref:Anaphase promoting complex subunit 1 n=1 Tax=Paramicrosporidium saccamoebae TaxID=1246581 RepID=A0A2H9TNC3_9FUNG|nr:Anaphase promoting complex subunit 1 [Paramicrosporidium saccamoebae]
MGFDELLAAFLHDPLNSVQRRVDLMETLSEDQRKQLPLLAMLYLQERLLDSLVARSEIESLLKSVLQLHPDSKVLHKACNGTLDYLELLVVTIPASGCRSVLDILSGRILCHDALEECISDRLYDDNMPALFPLCRCLEEGGPMVARLIEPIRSILQFTRPTIKKNAEVALDAYLLVKNYLDTSKTTILNLPPPSSMLRLYSDTAYEAENVFIRKTLGKCIGQSLQLCGAEKSPSMNIVDYLDFCPNLRVKGAVGGNVGPNPFNSFAKFASGVSTACRDYAFLTADEGAALVKTVKPDTLDESFSGLILALGLMGKLSRISTMETLGLISCGHALTEAASLLAIAASHTSQGDSQMYKVAMINITQQDAGVSFQIPPSLRVVSPLALGLMQAFRGDQTCSNIMMRMIEGNYTLEPISFDAGCFVLNCGIALSLLHNPDSMRRTDVLRLLRIIRAPLSTYHPAARTAALLALVNCPARLAVHVDPELTEVLSMDCLPFMDVILARYVQQSINKKPSWDLWTTLSDQKDMDLNKLLLCTADILFMGTTLTPLESTTQWIADFLRQLRKQFQSAALSYSTRYRRLVLSTCHDLILLGGCLCHAGSNDQELLRTLSHSFCDSLDYSFGRSICHSLAASFLIMEHSKLALIKESPPNLIHLLLLPAVLPMTSMVPSEDPSVHFRLYLPLILLQELQDRLVSDPLDSLERWRGRTNVSCDAMKVITNAILSTSKEATIDELIQLGRILY